nr:zinc finger protein 26-like isoform X6 [Misgurnus anguillicaudatus]
MMECVKEETDPESFTITPQHTQQQRDLLEVKEEGQEHNGMKDEHKDHNFMTASCSETDENSSQERVEAKNVFECHLCDKTFSKKGKLTYHLRIHTKAPHTCSHCEKTFIDKSKFVDHIRSHTDIKRDFYFASWSLSCGDVIRSALPRVCTLRSDRGVSVSLFSRTCSILLGALCKCVYHNRYKC